MSAKVSTLRGHSCAASFRPGWRNGYWVPLATRIRLEQTHHRVFPSGIVSLHDAVTYFPNLRDHTILIAAGEPGDRRSRLTGTGGKSGLQLWRARKSRPQQGNAPGNARGLRQRDERELVSEARLRKVPQKINRR
jgi:hypothetical protein